MFMLKKLILPGVVAVIVYAVDVAGAVPTAPEPAPAPAPTPTPTPGYFSETEMLAPLTLAQVPTTDGRLYLNNLDATISNLQGLVSSRAPDLMMLQLSRSLYNRFRIVGSMADMEQARALAEQAVRAMPMQSDTWLLLAKLQASFHEFAPALESLQKAEELDVHATGVPAVAAAIVRYEIEQAMTGGMVAPNLAGLPEPRALAEFVQRANDAINLGDLSKADELMTRAQYIYQDSNPFPLAWLHVQQGIAFLRFGDPARARVFFQAAHDRLPAYYLATEHLAEAELLSGNAEAAARLYQEVYLQTANPEFLGGLAMAQALMHDENSAATMARAFQEYDALVEHHPAMYWQHAAKFYLKQGNAEKAMALAERNLGIRQDLQSLILFASAAAHVGATDAACDTFDLSMGSGSRPPELLTLQNELTPVCAGNDRLHN